MQAWKEKLVLRSIKEGIHADIGEQGRQAKVTRTEETNIEGLTWKGKKEENVQGPLVQGKKHLKL